MLEDMQNEGRFFVKVVVVSESGVLINKTESYNIIKPAMATRRLSEFDGLG